MLRSFFIIAWRTLIRYRMLSIINILGLSIGMACCILVGLFIMDELSYDKQNKDSSRIYRVVKDFIDADGNKMPDATTPPAIAAAIQKDVPEIEHVVRLFPGWENKFYVRYQGKKFIEENIFRADSSLFDVFTIPFIKGNPKTAMDNPNAVILTESIAKKYFGNEDPIGKTLDVDDWEPQVVTAIIKDIPDNAHFKIDLLVPLRFREEGSQIKNINAIWNWHSYYTYIKLQPGAKIEEVDKKIRAVFKKNQPESKDYFYSQPLTSIHLNSSLKWELRPNGDKVYVYIFATIALFILAIACMNYVNLTTACSSSRAKEIGIKKVTGAVRSSLISQFLTESVMLALVASIVALIMAQLLLPAVNNITGKRLTLILHGNYFIIPAIFGFSILIGLLAGLYPALYLSSIEPIRILKGEKLSRIKNLNLRKILVVMQFTISIMLIIGTIIIIQQINFIRSAKLGFDKDHVIVVNDIGYLDEAEKAALKNELLQLPGVKKVAAADGVVGGLNWARKVRYKGSLNSQLVNFLSVDEDFIDALNIKLKEGRNFYHADTTDVTILNETAAKELGIPSPVIGQQIIWSKDLQTGRLNYATVIGIVKDFHFLSMKNEIKPFVFVKHEKREWNYTIKISEANNSRIISAIKNVWDKNVHSRPFQYTLLDETYAKLYSSEMNFEKFFSFITSVAIFIACLGLFGLSSFITRQRTKEVGIRKTLGASVPNIVGMLSRDFIKLIIISSAISFPLAWSAMHSWLQNFAYRINISWWVFFLAGFLAMLIALMTISFQTIRAAITNPVDSLREE